MIDFCELVYDGPVSSTLQYTPQASWSLLAGVDRLVIHAAVSNASAAGVEFNLLLETSNDGVGCSGPASNKVTLSATGTRFPLAMNRDGTTPAGCLARLGVYMTGAGTTCYAQVRVCGRDD